MISTYDGVNQMWQVWNEVVNVDHQTWPGSYTAFAPLLHSPPMWVPGQDPTPDNLRPYGSVAPESAVVE